MSDWDKAYEQYSNRLRTGQVDESFFRNLYDQIGKSFSDNVVNIFNELKEQRQLTDDSWYGGKIGKENATWDMAFRLAESGVGSVYDIGQRQVETTDGEGGYLTESVLFDKRTGEPLNMPRMSSGTFDLDYELSFTPDGVPIAYTGNKQSGWVSFRENVIKPALPIALMAFPGIGQAIGTALTPAGTSAAVAGAVGAGVVGGTMAELTGGSFIKGAILGAAGAGATNFAGDIGKMIGLQGKMAEQVGNAIIAGARAELAGGDFVKGAGMAGLISGISNTTGYSEGDIKKVISSVKALDSGNPFKIAGAMMNLSKLDYFNKVAAEDLAGGLIPQYGTNKAYGEFMKEAMTPEAQAAMENMIYQGQSPEDIAGGLDPRFGTTKLYNEAITSTTQPTKTDDSIEFNPLGAVVGFAIGQNLPKDKQPNAADLYSKSKGATTSTSTSLDYGDIYKDAPIQGFAMRKFKNKEGQEKYIPFVGDSPQLIIPEGFEPAGMNKGGFIKRRS